MIWSDEKKFNLDGPDGYRYYWHDLRKEERYFSKRVQGGGGVMVWGAFCARGSLQLAFPEHRLNSQRYQDILRTRLLPPYQVLAQQGYVFQRDNAPCHVSRSTRAWEGRHGIRSIEWPSCSPDLNPIENIWGILVRRIYADNKQFRTKEELRDAIEQAWADLDQQTIDNLMNSMNNRVFQVINRNGGPTDY